MYIYDQSSSSIKYLKEFKVKKKKKFQANI